jgi:hypothetical protein
MFGMKDKPRYIHDCDGCIYLGNRDEFDVYYCFGSAGSSWGAGSIILRFGDECSDYSSSPLSMALCTEYGLTSASDIMREVAVEIMRRGYVRVNIDNEKIEEDREIWSDYWELRK